MDHVIFTKQHQIDVQRKSDIKEIVFLARVISEDLGSAAAEKYGIAVTLRGLFHAPDVKLSSPKEGVLFLKKNGKALVAEDLTSVRDDLRAMANRLCFSGWRRDSWKRFYLDRLNQATAQDLLRT